MLKGISALISPELLKTMAEMGHGDQLVLSDAHFPAHSCGRPVIRADGIPIAALLDAILPLFELDRPGPSIMMMEPELASLLDPQVEADYLRVVRQHQPSEAVAGRLARFDFYEACRNSFAIVMTGELRPYGNVILNKGVTPVS